RARGGGDLERAAPARPPADARRFEPGGAAVNLLVTGAAGMLAQALIPALEAAGHQVLAPPEAELDVTLSPVRLAHEVAAWHTDWVIHLAAFTKVDECETRVDTAFAVNAEGSLHVALAAREAGAGVLALSTDYVF